MLRLARGLTQALRDFHEASQSRTVVPVLCAENAPARNLRLHVVDKVDDLLLANAATLRDAIEVITGVIVNRDDLTIDEFERAADRPTPTIVEAARELYAGHSVAEIGRGDAADEELQAAADALRRVMASAAIEKRHVVCFVSGAPSAGKTLLGLDLALKSRSNSRVPRPLRLIKDDEVLRRNGAVRMLFQVPKEVLNGPRQPRISLQSWTFRSGRLHPPLEDIKKKLGFGLWPPHESQAHLFVGKARPLAMLANQRGRHSAHCVAGEQQPSEKVKLHSPSPHLRQFLTQSCSMLCKLGSMGRQR